MSDVQILAAGGHAAPLDYTLNNLTELIPKACYAVFNGTSAAGSFQPCLVFTSASGDIIARIPVCQTVAAGGSATVSWFPGVEPCCGATQTTGGGGTVDSVTSPTATLAVVNPTGPAVTVDMPATGVGAGTYGDATHVSEITVDAEGRITGATSVPISGSGGAGGLIVLYDSGYLGADAASIDTGAGGVASGHFGIVVMAYLRSTAALVNDNIVLTLNNDGSAIYTVNRIRNSGAVLTGAESVAATSAQCGVVPAANATASYYGTLYGVIPAYDGTSNFKTGQFTSGALDVSGVGTVEDVIGVAYGSASAISRLKIAPATGGANFKAGSRMIVYGVQ